MSLLDKLKEKHNQKILNEELTNYGIVIGSITPSDFNPKTSRFFSCLVRSMLIFFATFGTIGAVVSGLDLPFYPLLVIPALIVITIAISFLYYNRITFYIGYIFFFIVFTVSIFALYFYINSGFQAFVNVLYEKYSDYFNLSTLRQATEFIADRRITVSVTMIFVGAFLSLLLNITISGYMSLIETFLITFPLLQLVLYINLKPDTIYLIMLISVYISVGILRRSSFYRMPAIKHNKESYITLKNKRKKSWMHIYISNGQGLLRIAVYSVIFASAFLLICNNNFFNSFNSRNVRNQLKNTTDEYVKIVVQQGVVGLFNRYSNVGGLNSGKIGGVGSVRPDYETDLEVTYVPLSAAPVYLKGFTGVNYDNSSFSSNYDYGADNTPVYRQTYYSMADYLHPTNNYAFMHINNIDADSNYVYMPYDSIVYSSDIITETSVNVASRRKPFNTARLHVGYFGSSLADIDDQSTRRISNLYKYDHSYAYANEIPGFASYDLIYDPYVPSISLSPDLTIPSDYDEAVKDECLAVPGRLKNTLDQFNEDAGLDYYKDALLNAASDEERCQLTLAACSTLKGYFFNEYPYTMAPGATPRNEDAIEYFLTVQKKGYCAHFAASSTMILRNLGIPARYCEGYVIQYNDISDNAVAISDDTNGWLELTSTSGYGLLDDTGVITVDVTDGSAHAWVEIYIDGYGWIPYEFTPPSTGETLSDFSLGGLFSGLFRATNRMSTSETTTNVTPVNLDITVDFSSSLAFIYIPLIIVLIAIVLILIIRYFGPARLEAFLIKHYERKGLYNKALVLFYKHFAIALKKKELITSTNMYIKDLTDLLADKELITKEQGRLIYLTVSGAYYGADTINESDYNTCTLALNKVLEALKKSKK